MAISKSIIRRPQRRRGDSAQPDGQARGPVDRELADRVPKGAGHTSRPAVIEVRGLRKSYDGVEAVAGIDLTVREGEIFLGPNGAGKTTTVEILEGYRRRSAGEVSVLGVDPIVAGRDWRARGSAWSCRSRSRRTS
jgi:ABC-type molybdenum transport system ATPase subunit/photorepair protein PhrA